MTLPNHKMYDELLTKMEGDSKVSKNVLARVLVRMIVSAPNDVARADIASGKMLAKPSTLNQSAVSKAVACLVKNDLVTQYESRTDVEGRAGRPIVPLSLGSTEWAVMGVKVVHEMDHPVRLYGVLTEMRVDRDLTCLAELEEKLPDDVTFHTVAPYIKRLHDALLAQLPHPRRLFGVGVEVAAHVHDGVVIGATHLGLSTGEEFDLLKPLQDLLKVPVVIDNDVNVLAVRETYRPLAERHVAVVAVLHDGVGAALIIDGHVYRGGGGMAAEPGHQVVANLPSLPPAPAMREDHVDVERSGLGVGFNDKCHCGRTNHVDCYAVPRRLMAELGAPLAIAGRSYARDSSQLTREALIFRTGGEALGQSIASIINIVNPSRVLLILPAELARADARTEDISKRHEIAGLAEPGTAAAEYLEGVEDAITNYSFSRGARDARAGDRRLTVKVLERGETEKQGAVCAAIRVLDAFVTHALERDRCYELAVDGSTPPAVTRI